MENIKITVAVVCYNNAQTIAKAIKSVEDQQMAGVELIVIDDCSTDNSQDVITGLLANGSDFKFYTTPSNSGSASAARNIAIDKARGTYLTFLDGDDVLAENACFNLYTNAVKYGVDIVTAQMVRRQVKTGETTPWHGWLFKESRTISSANEEPDLVYDSTSTNKTYSVAFLRDNGLRFTEGVYFEDNEFSQKAFALARGIRVIPDVVYIWEVYPAEERLTITSDWKNVQSYSDRIRAFALGYNYYGKAGMDEIKRKLLNKTVKYDIWLFIDAAFANKDFSTFMNLWKEALPVIDLLEEKDLDDLPLKQRAKVAALMVGDLEAFSEAGSISTNPNQLKGYLAGDLWIPSNWTPSDEKVEEVRQFLKVRNDDLGNVEARAINWEHNAKVATARAGAVWIEGSTEDRTNYFDRSAPLRVYGRLIMKGGDLVQTIEGSFDGWSGFTFDWSLQIDEVLEDSMLRNQHWRLELSVIQGEKFAQAEVMSPAGFRPLAFAPKTPASSCVVLDRFGLFAWKGRALYVRRWSREMPWGVGARVSSTFARHRNSVLDKITGKTSRDNVLRAIGFANRKFALDRDLILFESHMGKQYSDSPRAIYEELSRQRPDLNVFWSTADFSDFGVCPTHMVRRHSDSYARILARASVLVDNQGFPSYFKTRPDQMYLQTWHGVPLKQMGKDSHSKSAKELAEIRQSVANWTLTFEPSPYYKRYLNEAMFYDGPTLEAGLPRNDVLLQISENDEAKARANLGLREGKRYVLWAPTFRETGKYGVPSLDSILNLEELVEKLSDDVVLLVRPHYLNKMVIPKHLSEKVLDVSGIDEISKLYIAADMLVTDYSSVMFDFAITGKPIVIFAPDYDDYRASQRGVIFDIASESPGPFVSDEASLVREIEQSLEEPGEREQYSEFITKFVGANYKSASKAAVERILEWIA